MDSLGNPGMWTEIRSFKFDIPTPDGFIYVPSGSFVMNDNYYKYSRPAYVDAYFISKYEVTWGEYINYLNEALANNFISIDVIFTEK